MKSFLNPNFRKLFKQLPKDIRISARKQYQIFKQNPYHASLHFKRVHSNKPIYSCRININYRTIGIIEENNIIWFWIGSHDDYDKLLQNI